MKGRLRGEPGDQTSVAKSTLTRRLILRTATIMAILATALGVATSLAMQRIMEQSIDDALASSQAAHWRESGSQHHGGHSVIPMGEAALEVELENGIIVYARVYSHGVEMELDSAQVQVVRAVHDNGRPGTVDVPGLGEWRVSRQVRDGYEYLVGMPMYGLHEFVRQVIIIEFIVTVIAITAAGVVMNVVVRNSLRPLSQMAATAERVAQMNLGRGTARIEERVPINPEEVTSEVGQVALALNTMLDNVDDALVARQASETKLRRFVADASHELRNPLASIRGYAELTRLVRNDLPPDAGFALSRIESESKRMSKLVDDLLLLAGLDAGRTPTFEQINLTELLVNAVADAQAAGPEHEWSVDTPESPVLMQADAGQLQQVLANLLSNSRKHTPPGTTVEAALRVVNYSKSVLLTVTDNGPGIPSDVLPTVFERFTRADAARTHSAEASTGLGLAIVAAIVATHSGQVRVDSVPGRTVFTVTLPVGDTQP